MEVKDTEMKDLAEAPSIIVTTQDRTLKYLPGIVADGRSLYDERV